jgi:hypothetical protein
MEEIVSQSIKVDVFVGDLQAIASGTIHVSDKRKLKILIEDITLLFEFEIDKADEATKYKSHVVTEKHWLLL